MNRNFTLQELNHTLLQLQDQIHKPLNLPLLLVGSQEQIQCQHSSMNLPKIPLKNLLTPLKALFKI